MADNYFNREVEDPNGEDGIGGACPGIIREDFGDMEYPPSAMIEKLEEYFASGRYNGQMVARTILYTLRTVTLVEEDVEAVFKTANALDNDTAPSARAEFMEQVPHIAQFCREDENKSHIIPQKLLPMVVKFFTDKFPLVRKTAQAALLVLMEQELVDKRDVEEQVCPVILNITQSFPEGDCRTEAAALLSKLAPLIGKELSERIFLEQFAKLCSDETALVRQVCADNFGDFSSVVGSESTEKFLLPKFLRLCKDHVWKIRKSCADVFMPVSCLCSSETRERRLSPFFIDLLRDESQWVRLAAFQALGPFISTFADSSITDLLHNTHGEIVIVDVKTLSNRLDELELKRSRERESMPLSAKRELKRQRSNESVISRNSQIEYIGGETNSFNSFLYWRCPLPPLRNEDLPCDFTSEKESHSVISDKLNSHGFTPASFEIQSETSSELNLTADIGGCKNIFLENRDKHPQNIVPQALVDHFVSMVGSDVGAIFDEETAHHYCAFSFPAVALTLGRSNWHLLKGVYAALANDVKWKVRHIMASSIYELGIILGGEMVGSDLLPIFHAFINDLDEVRIGILKHLSDFIRLLKPHLREEFLPLLSKFLFSYNDRNWRFREELALQIGNMMDLYSAENVKETLAPIVLVLIEDRVAAVRQASLNVLCAIINCIKKFASNDGLSRSLLADLAEKLSSNKAPWVSRQTYASLSYQILSTGSLDVSQFALYILPFLLHLANDPVPNVRIAVARVLVDHICNIEYFNSKANPCHLSVVKTLALLGVDSDIDVRYLVKSYTPDTSSEVEYFTELVRLIKEKVKVKYLPPSYY